MTKSSDYDSENPASDKREQDRTITAVLAARRLGGPTRLARAIWAMRYISDSNAEGSFFVYTNSGLRYGPWCPTEDDLLATDWRAF